MLSAKLVRVLIAILCVLLHCSSALPTTMDEGWTELGPRSDRNVATITRLGPILTISRRKDPSLPQFVLHNNIDPSSAIQTICGINISDFDYYYAGDVDFPKLALARFVAEAKREDRAQTIVNLFKVSILGQLDIEKRSIWYDSLPRIKEILDGCDDLYADTSIILGLTEAQLRSGTSDSHVVTQQRSGWITSALHAIKRDGISTLADFIYETYEEHGDVSVPSDTRHVCVQCLGGKPACLSWGNSNVAGLTISRLYAPIVDYADTLARRSLVAGYDRRTTNRNTMMRIRWAWIWAQAEGLASSRNIGWWDLDSGGSETVCISNRPEGCG